MKQSTKVVFSKPILWLLQVFLKVQGWLEKKVQQSQKWQKFVDINIQFFRKYQLGF